MNPMLLMQAKGMLEQFQRNHPRVFPFLQDAGNRVEEGTIIEMKVTTLDGKTICSNIKVTADDMEMIRKIKEIK